MKSITILGAGESGFGAALLAHLKGFNVFVSDSNKINEEKKSEMTKKSILFEEENHSFDKIKLSDYVIKSPGISNSSELNSKINVTELSGLLTTFAKDQNATCIIRGLRAVSDFEYEFQMTGMNYQLNPDIETIFLMTSEKNSFISSNFVKEVHKLGGDVSNFVSKNTLEQLNKKNS